MQNFGVLVAGIAFVGVTVGYMVGGSATPVVSVAVPAVFGLVVTAIALMQGSLPSKEYAELLKSAGDQAGMIPEVAQYRRRLASAPRTTGTALIVFCVAYMAGCTFGAKVRIDNLLVRPSVPPAFPWSASDTKPPTIAFALEWIALQSRLRQLGYDEQQIRELFEIQVQEWKNVAAQARGAEDEAAADATKSKATLPSKDADLLRQWLKLPDAQKGTPFAHQPPPKELAEKLKNVS